ncbi:MAG: hypothetical protein ABJM90_05605 [Paracoccaceae bacterium]
MVIFLRYDPDFEPVERADLALPLWTLMSAFAISSCYNRTYSEGPASANTA